MYFLIPLLQIGADFLLHHSANYFNFPSPLSLYPGIGLQLTLYQFIKKSDSHLSSNYRPISLTSIVIKVMERIIHRQLVKALESHNLISNYQHGFRGHRSTVSLLLIAIHDWAACLERHHSVHCIFLT